MVTSPRELKILEWDEKSQTNYQTNKKHKQTNKKTNNDKSSR